MYSNFKNIRVLIWDFDGTFYKMIPEIHDMYRENEYRVIMQHTGWSREKTIAEFNKLHLFKKSGTLTAAILSNISVVEAALECESSMDKAKYLQKDERLSVLFNSLHTFTHFMLVNGIQNKTRQGLAKLGIEQNLFREIVTSEIVGENKPSEKGFRYILEKTGLPSEEHLMIGDRELVDLEPAKKLGMKTCFVWSETPGKIADVTLPTVYELEKMLLICI